MRVTYLTAGAGGMYCGSCLQDNTLARALRELGVDAMLVPLYTPIRTDEPDVSQRRVFLGGVNVYLQDRFAWFRRLPAWADRVLDHPRLLRWAAARAPVTDARVLGRLTLSVLDGPAGRQAKEVERLCRWLARSARPDVVHLSNLLIGGCIERVREATGAAVVVTVQGDDLFLRRLAEPFREPALARLRRLAAAADALMVYSRSYADCMARLLEAPRDKFQVVPLGIDTGPAERLGPRGPAAPEGPPVVGYLARVAPEKGLHVLVEAFRALRAVAGMGSAQLRIAGYCAPYDRAYLERSLKRLEAGAAQYVGELDGRQKWRFLRRLDVLATFPTWPEAKGRYILEALAAGTPVAAPAHGASLELIGQLGGGRLAPPGDPGELARLLADMLSDREAARRLGEQARRRVLAERSAAATARAVAAWYRRLVG